MPNLKTELKWKVNHIKQSLSEYYKIENMKSNMNTNTKIYVFGEYEYS